MIKGFIRYQEKKGRRYASYNIAKREGKNKRNISTNLGLVIDEEKGIFENLKQGIFTFSLENGYGEVLSPPNTAPAEKLILDFGDSWLLSEIIKKTGFNSILNELFPLDTDTLQAYLAFKILDPGFAANHAEDWWLGSYSRILYPKADLSSQRISDFLSKIGEEACWRNFFHMYLKFVSKMNNEHAVLIDSTGLPNDIHFDLTAINNHNGVISNETRLLLVVDKNTGMPIYFRYMAGNIVDVTTLKNTLKELSAYGIDVKFTIIDAGYYSEGNLESLISGGIPFVIRMSSNRKLYKELTAKHAGTLMDPENIIFYKKRLLYTKRDQITLYGKKIYAYIMIDANRRADETYKYSLDTYEDKSISAKEKREKLQTKGMFVILSAACVEEREILPLYYTRQSIEQVFDFAKNNVDLLPLRIHSEKTLRGHLLTSFISTAVFILVNQMLNGANFSAIDAFHKMRRLKVKIFESCNIVQEPDKIMNDMIKSLKLTIPT